MSIHGSTGAAAFLPALKDRVSSGRLMNEQSRHYVVEGRWPFPVDMLRKDRSVAATDEDRRKIDLLSGETSPDTGDRHAKVSITLLAPEEENFRPCTERWESFGWSVPGDTLHQLVKESRELGRRRKLAYERAMAKLDVEEIEALRYHFS